MHNTLTVISVCMSADVGLKSLKHTSKCSARRKSTESCDAVGWDSWMRFLQKPEKFTDFYYLVY